MSARICKSPNLCRRRILPFKYQPIVPMRTELLELFDISELKKYMTDEELTGLSGYSASAAEEKPSEASAAPARKAGE